MIEQLFGSKTRVKLLRLFYGNVNRSFYVREITRKVDEQINSVRRELSNLLSIGIITSDTSNNKVYYEVNQKFEHFEPLEQLFGGRTARSKRKKAVAADDSKPAAEQTSESSDLKQLGNVEVAALMGQFTRDETSGVDILIVGDVNPNAVQKYVTEMEEQEGKELRYTVLASADLRYRLQIKDKFISNVLLSKKQILVDKDNLLAQKNL